MSVRPFKSAEGTARSFGLGWVGAGVAPVRYYPDTALSMEGGVTNTQEFLVLHGWSVFCNGNGNLGPGNGSLGAKKNSFLLLL